MRDRLVLVIPLILLTVSVLILFQLNADFSPEQQVIQVSEVPFRSTKTEAVPLRSGGRVNQDLIFYNRVNKCGSSTMNVLFHKGSNVTFIRYPGALDNRFITETQQVK